MCASPQKENGYTAIANEILEAFARTPNLGLANGQVLWAIIRKTYGWNKKEDAISISQIMRITGLSKRWVIYTVQKLESRNILIIKRERRGMLHETNVIRFNKNYDSWVVHDSVSSIEKKRIYDRLRSARLRKDVRGSARFNEKVVHDSQENVKNRAHTKDTITKDTITKDIEPPPFGGEAKEVVQIEDCVNAIFKIFYDGGNKGINFGNTTQRKAAEFIVSTHGIEQAEVIAKYAISVQGEQYAPMITNPYQLKEKYGQLKSYWQRQSQGNSKFKFGKIG